MKNIRVFISYSSRDREAAESIHERLAAAGFDVWRGQTRLETDWSKEIAYALAESDVLCLLWSEHSAESKWVKHEWLTARALEKRIIPCLFPTAPTLPEPLYNLQGVSFPSLEEGSKQLIERVKGEAFLPVKYDYKVLPGNSYIPFNPNPFFTGRHADLLDLYMKMIGNLNKIGINQVGTVGMGGIGKTQLAVEFAYRLSFGFQGIYWVQAADPYRWADEFISIARDRLKLKVKDPDRPEAERQYIFALQDYFKSHPNTLVVMDNVTDPKLLNNDGYLFGIPPLTLGCDLLFTTRKHFQLPGVSSQSVNILSSDAAYNLLKSYRVPQTFEEEYAKAICNAVGNLPLAIILAGAYLRDYRENISFADYSNELKKKRLGSIDIGDMSEESLATRHVAAVKATLQSQWEMLKDENARYLFKLAGQFPEAAIIPKARLGLLAGIKPGQSRLDQPLAKALNQLHDLCLLEKLESDASAARLHPLVRDFAFNLIPEEERGNFRSAAAQNLKEAYFDYPRLEAQVLARGVQKVIEDLQVGIDWWGIDRAQKQDLELFHGALRLSSHVLFHDQAQLAGQLIGRLIAQESSGIISFLEQIRTAKRGPWLCPYSASMIPPGGPLIRMLIGHTAQVQTLSLTPDGKRAVSGSMDHTIKVWNLETGRELRTLKGHSSTICAVAVTPDGRRAVSGSWDRTLKVWDLETGQELRTLEGHADWVRAVTVTPDGRRAVSGSKDGTLKVWDLETGRELRTLKGHTDEIDAVTVTAEGRRVISGPWDRTLKVWDLETGREMASFTEDAKIYAVAMGPDDKTLVAGDMSGRVHFLRLEGFDQ